MVGRKAKLASSSSDKNTDKSKNHGDANHKLKRTKTHKSKNAHKQPKNPNLPQDNLEERKIMESSQSIFYSTLLSSDYKNIPVIEKPENHILNDSISGDLSRLKADEAKAEKINAKYAKLMDEYNDRKSETNSKKTNHDIEKNKMIENYLKSDLNKLKTDEKKAEFLNKKYSGIIDKLNEADDSEIEPTSPSDEVSGAPIKKGLFGFLFNKKPLANQDVLIDIPEPVSQIDPDPDKSNDDFDYKMQRIEREKEALNKRESELDELKDQLLEEKKLIASQNKEFEENISNSDEIGNLSKTLKILKLSVEKLRMQEERHVKKLSELDKEISMKTSEYDAREKKLDLWESRLNNREKDLDERENILLTMQADIIKERRELDNREFSLYMKEELAGSNVDYSESQHNNHAEFKSKRSNSDNSDVFQVELLIEQTIELLKNSHVKDAKLAYNRLVTKFNDLKCSADEKRRLHLLLLELYNDISITELSKRKI